MSDEDFRTAFQRLLVDAHAKLQPQTEWVVPEGAAVDIRKLQTFIAATCCEMTDAFGDDHCDHEPPPRPPLPRRLRWRVQSWWSGLRMRVGSWIAGVDPDREDGW